MTFSERMGLEPIRNTIQVNSLDTDTRNALWNLAGPFLWKVQYLSNITVCRDIWTELYHQPSDERPPGHSLSPNCVTDADAFYQYFRQVVIQAPWNKCLDLIEFLAAESHREKWLAQSQDVKSGCERICIPSTNDYNAVFERHMVGYRFIGDTITPISDATEIQAIEEAMQSPEDAVRDQFAKAIKYLSDRTCPDYAKSIDCSLSAVESQCRILLRDKEPTLGEALALMKAKGFHLHPSLVKAFQKLFGYASDAAGIRHGGLSPADEDQAVAKFMLVACTAFVNYLLSAGNA